ncbi:MAG: glycosyltransferase [Fidelibacterota bacterium]
MAGNKIDPSISVIIPTFNRLPLLKEAVESVLNQTYKLYELIVVDDGSTDGTAEYIKSLRVHVKYYFQENRGVSEARNRGIQMTGGEYICFLDSDDYWLRDKLSVQIDFFRKNPDYRICQTEEIWIRRGRRVNPTKRHRKCGGWIFQQCIPLCIVSPSAVMIHRSVFREVGGFDPDLPVCEDYDLWLRVSLRYPIGLIEKALIVKRGGHANQLSKQYWGMDRFRVKALEKLLEHEDLNREQHILVLEEIIKKLRILRDGSRKRGNEQRTELFQKKLELYSREYERHV